MCPPDDDPPLDHTMLRDDDPNDERAEALVQATRRMSPAERDAWIQRTTAGDEALRSKVEALLVEQTLAPTDPGPGDAAELPSVPGVVMVRKIGSGGMGDVFLGRQDFVDRNVAVKFLRQESATFQKRFQREAKILAQLKHPNIIPCFDGGVLADGRCYMVMDYVEPPDFEEWLQRNGPLPVNCATQFGIEIASALEYARTKNIIHRDVKPPNILLKRRTDVPADHPFPFTALLSDLGLARPLKQPGLDTDLNLSQPGVAMGSPATMAPEQYDGYNVDHRSDIYGLGCVLYQALTGKRAFPQTSMTALVSGKSAELGPDPGDVAKSLPKPLRELVRSMMANKPADRPQSYVGIIEDLRVLKERTQPTGSRSSGTQGGGGLKIAALVAVLGAGGAFLALDPLGLRGKSGKSGDVPSGELAWADGEEDAMLRASEGQSLMLQAAAQSEDDVPLRYRWKLEDFVIGGVPAEREIQAMVKPGTPGEDGSWSLDLPNLSAPYTLMYEVKAEPEAGGRSIERVVTVEVDAEDQPAQGTGELVLPAEPQQLSTGGSLEIDGPLWSDPDLDQAVQYEWSASNDAVKVDQDDPESPSAEVRLLRPLKGPLEVELTLKANGQPAGMGAIQLRPRLAVRWEDDPSAGLTRTADEGDVLVFVAQSPDGGMEDVRIEVTAEGLDLPPTLSPKGRLELALPEATTNYTLTFAAILPTGARREAQVEVRADDDPPTALEPPSKPRALVLYPGQRHALAGLEWRDDGGDVEAAWSCSDPALIRDGVITAPTEAGSFQLEHWAEDSSGQPSQRITLYELEVDPARTPIRAARELLDLDTPGTLLAEPAERWHPSPALKWLSDPVTYDLQCSVSDSDFLHAILRGSPRDPFQARYRAPLGDWRCELVFANRVAGACRLALEGANHTWIVSLTRTSDGHEATLFRVAPDVDPCAPDALEGGEKLGGASWTREGTKPHHLRLNLTRRDGRITVAATALDERAEPLSPSPRLDGLDGVQFDVPETEALDLGLHLTSMASVCLWTLAPL